MYSLIIPTEKGHSFAEVAFQIHYSMYYMAPISPISEATK